MIFFEDIFSESRKRFYDYFLGKCVVNRKFDLGVENRKFEVCVNVRTASAP